MPDFDHPFPAMSVDPAQACFVFPLDSATPEVIPAADLLPPNTAPGADVYDLAQPNLVVRPRRQPPKRARISFVAPARLKARLDRTAHDLDRSKTTLLREAVGNFLKALDEREGKS